MRHRGIATAFAICGCVIGAGFASGREVAAFFTRFGSWSAAAMISAVAVIGLISNGMLACASTKGMPLSWQGTRLETCWQALFALLMVVTGGAMLSGSGEIAALMLPFRNAQTMGMVVTLALGVLLTAQNHHALPSISTALIICLLGMMVLGLRTQPSSGAHLAQARRPLQAILSGVCYGGLNMALALPAMTDGLVQGRERRCAVALTCVLLGTLLFLGNALLLRHPELMDAPMPLVHLLRSYGLSGYRLCGATLYLAVLTTLLSALKGLRTLCAGRTRAFMAGVGAVIIMALMGFSRIVDVVYPLLGGACFLLMVMAIFHHWREESK